MKLTKSLFESFSLTVPANQVFEQMLLCSFKGKPGEIKVRNGRYFILNTRIPGEIITRDDWRKLVFPGSQIHMSILLARVYGDGSNCLRPGCSGTACKQSIRQDEIVEWFVSASQKYKVN
jgi:hypothetical protein